MARDRKAARDAFIQRVEHRRKVVGISQEELAERIGATQSSLSAQLNTKKTGYLAGGVIIRLPKALGCGYRWLFDGPPAPEIEPSTSPTVASVDGYLSALTDIEQCVADLKAKVRPPRPLRLQ